MKVIQHNMFGTVKMQMNESIKLSILSMTEYGNRKSLQLSKKQRAVVETIIDCVLKGEKVVVDIDNHENPI